MSATQIEESSPGLKISQTEDTYTTSKIVADPTVEWTPAYFSPPLAAERNGWVLNQLRRYSIRTILDIGCGEGSLLRSLCEPSRERYDPCTPLDHDVSSRPLYPILLAGLDLDLSSVKAAAERTIPREFDPAAPRYAPNGIPRWDELRLRLWHGGIEDVNEELVDRYQCFVSMEVVEHLQGDVLELFLPLVLGYYRPEYLLLTTPNYLFNELFSAPANSTPIMSPDASVFIGFPDPTGTTSRIFRHPDHKREWTPTEWREWCEEGARKHGYSVEVSSVGWLGRPDPFGREVEGGHGGSLTAVFHRIEERERGFPANFTRAVGDSVCASAPASQPSTAHKHTLVAENLHTPHPDAGLPLPASRILSYVRDVFSQSPDNELPLDMIWLSNRIDVACGGSPRVLLDAFLTSESQPEDQHEECEWVITQGSSSDLLSWFVLWRRWTQPPLLEGNTDVWATEEAGDPLDETTEEDEYGWLMGAEHEAAEARIGVQTEEFCREPAAIEAPDGWHSQINVDWPQANGDGWGETIDGPSLATMMP